MIGTLLVCASLLAVDGDTIKCDGANMRDMGEGEPFVSGNDTPGIHRPKCQQELELGRAAKARMQELLSEPGIQIVASGQHDKTQSHRPLIWIYLADCRSIGSVLMGEGLAAKWTPRYRAEWCAGA